MSTRSITMVVDRSEAENNELGFACKPSLLADKSYVNMYLHHDGYIEGVGLDIAKWVKQMQDVKGFTEFSDPSRIASHLVKDFHYNSQYLYPNTYEIEVAYTYILWCGKSDVWISQWSEYEDKCTFVGSVEKLISKHNTD